MKNPRRYYVPKLAGANQLPMKERERLLLDELRKSGTGGVPMNYIDPKILKGLIKRGDVVLFTHYSPPFTLSKVNYRMVRAREFPKQVDIPVRVPYAKRKADLDAAGLRRRRATK